MTRLRIDVALLTLGVTTLALGLTVPASAQPKDEPAARAAGSGPADPSGAAPVEPGPASGPPSTRADGGATAPGGHADPAEPAPGSSGPPKTMEVLEEAADVPGNGVDRLDPTAPLEETTKIRIFRQAEKRLEAIKRAQEELRRREVRVLKEQSELARRYKSLRVIEDELSKGQAVREKARASENIVSIDEQKRLAEKAKTEAEKEAEQRAEARERLSAVFEKMKPSEIAKVVPEMDEELVVEILNRLKEKTTARVLGAVPPPLAARLSEKIARLKKKQQAESPEPQPK